MHRHGALRFEPTYKGLKLGDRFRRIGPSGRFEPTYKGLKRIVRVLDVVLYAVFRAYL